MTEQEQFKKRVAALATRLVSGMVDRGEIPETEDAMRAAVPQAVRDARAAIVAAEEFLCG